MDTDANDTNTMPNDTVRTSSSAGQPRILLVRPSALGDVSRTAGCLVALRRQFPHAQIDWLVAQTFADIVRSHPALNQVIPFDRKELGKFGRSWQATRQGLAFFNLLRKRRYDRVYDLQGLLRSGLFTWMTRAKHRAGFANGKEGAAFFYTERHRVDASMHTVNRMMQLLVADGVDAATQPPDLQLYLNPADRDWLNTYLPQNDLELGGYACMAPTAQWGCKCWPIEAFAQIGQRLLQGADGLPAMQGLILLCAPHERSQVKPIFKYLTNLGVDEQAIHQRVLMPETSVGQLAALISATRLLVCNDSAALHVGVGFDRPFVAIYGPTDPALVGPYHHRDWVVQPPNLSAQDMQAYRRHRDDDSLIRQVEIETVWQQVMAVLEQTSES